MTPVRTPHAFRRFAAVALVALTPACSPGADTGATTRPASPAAATAPRLAFDTTQMKIKDRPFTIEIADTEAKHAQGLMDRTSLPADRGMLFVFKTPDTYSFWMHNTLIPLDIIFLNAEGKVLEIHHRRPLDDTGRGPRDPALFVIELNAGAAQTIGLKPGDTVSLPEKFLKATPAPSDKTH
jgi:uncharacterized membrane protein (UPF0127 family)